MSHFGQLYPLLYAVYAHRVVWGREIHKLLVLHLFQVIRYFKVPTAFQILCDGGASDMQVLACRDFSIFY